MGVDVNLDTVQHAGQATFSKTCSSLQKERMPDFSEMIQGRLHLHHRLQHISRFACFLQEPYCKLAHFRCGIVQLRQEQSEHPCIGRRAATDETSQVVCGIVSNVLDVHVFRHRRDYKAVRDLPCIRMLGPSTKRCESGRRCEYHL